MTAAPYRRPVACLPRELFASTLEAAFKERPVPGRHGQNDRLAELAADIGGPGPVNRRRRRPAQAAMFYATGRALLASDDDAVARSAGMHWIAASWEQCGVELVYNDDGDEQPLDTLHGLPPLIEPGEADDWEPLTVPGPGRSCIRPQLRRTCHVPARRLVQASVGSNVRLPAGSSTS